MNSIIHSGTRHFLVVAKSDDGLYKVSMYQGRHKAWELKLEEKRLGVQNDIFQTNHPLNVSAMPYVPKELK